MNTTHRVLIVIAFIIASAASCPVSFPSTKASNKVLDYYWKDYVGIIPEDAIEGGTDESGNPTYIGQAYIKDYELLPAIIFSGCKTAVTTAYGKERTTDKNIKILCAKDKSRFKWVQTKNEETHLLTDHHFVVGGTEIGHPLNIGRVNYNGRLITGKIFSYPLPNRGLAIPYKGEPVVFQTYEILTYDVNTKQVKTDELPLILNVDLHYIQ